MQQFELIVIGAGVAGLTAAMVAARHGLKVAVVDPMGVGGQISTAERIENFPGFPQGIGGHELGPLLHEQAEASGAEFMLDTIDSIELAGDHRILHGATQTLRAPAIIIAAGSSLRPLGVPGEAQFLGRGVSHCASCDGPLFAGREVCVIGGGDSALDEALELAAHARRIIIIHRGRALRAQQRLQDRVAAATKIEIAFQTVVEEIIGSETVTAVRLRDLASGTVRVHNISGVFIYVGLEPNTEFLRDVLALDPAGHIQTDILMRTSLAGVFAAGDIRKHSVAQLAAAAGDGATAAITAFHYLRGRVDAQRAVAGL
jgi:thioredoxin reductase (NADPH)